MKFAIAIELGDQHQAFGVVIPDLPGCYSAGDTWDEALQNTYEAVELWCRTTLEDQGHIPHPRSLAEHQKNPALSDWSWDTIDVPVERYLGSARMTTGGLYPDPKNMPNIDGLVPRYKQA